MRPVFQLPDSKNHCKFTVKFFISKIIERILWMGCQQEFENKKIARARCRRTDLTRAIKIRRLLYYLPLITSFWNVLPSVCTFSK